jgi:hypothetical protein
MSKVSGPGRVGDVRSAGGTTTPAQSAPLSVQLAGSARPSATHPKVADVPGARVPFQDAFVTV